MPELMDVVGDPSHVRSDMRLSGITSVTLSPVALVAAFTIGGASLTVSGSQVTASLAAVCDDVSIVGIPPRTDGELMPYATDAGGYVALANSLSGGDTTHMLDI